MKKEKPIKRLLVISAVVFGSAVIAFSLFLKQKVLEKKYPLGNSITAKLFFNLVGSKYFNQIKDDGKTLVQKRVYTFIIGPVKGEKQQKAVLVLANPKIWQDNNLLVFQERVEQAVERWNAGRGRTPGDMPGSIEDLDTTPGDIDPFPEDQSPSGVACEVESNPLGVDCFELPQPGDIDPSPEEVAISLFGNCEDLPGGCPELIFIPIGDPSPEDNISSRECPESTHPAMPECLEDVIMDILSDPLPADCVFECTGKAIIAHCPEDASSRNSAGETLSECIVRVYENCQTICTGN